jgi:hypothetical protein
MPTTATSLRAAPCHCKVLIIADRIATLSWPFLMVGPPGPDFGCFCDFCPFAALESRPGQIFDAFAILPR